MAPPEDRTAEDVRVDEIRSEIEAIRLRIALAVDALAYKADVPSRLGDALSSAATTFTSRLLQRLPGGAKPTNEAGDEGLPVRSESHVEVNEPTPE